MVVTLARCELMRSLELVVADRLSSGRPDLPADFQRVTEGLRKALCASDRSHPLGQGFRGGIVARQRGGLCVGEVPANMRRHLFGDGSPRVLGTRGRNGQRVGHGTGPLGEIRPRGVESRQQSLDGPESVPKATHPPVELGGRHGRIVPSTAAQRDVLLGPLRGVLVDRSRDLRGGVGGIGDPAVAQPLDDLGTPVPVPDFPKLLVCS